MRIKRVYDPAAHGDGFRVLVDRLWPRGISKARADLDAWAKDIAPSTQLREWFNHQPRRWKTFRNRYLRELSAYPVELAALKARSIRRPVTLLYAARDPQHNHALVLKEAIEQLPPSALR